MDRRVKPGDDARYFVLAMPPHPSFVTLKKAKPKAFSKILPSKQKEGRRSAKRRG
jgi:hypothetical protein